MTTLAFLSALLMTFAAGMVIAETNTGSSAKETLRNRRAVVPGSCGRSVVQSRNANFHRIVGGQEAVAHSFPFIVSIQKFKNKHFCGGSIIRTGNAEESNIVVTAAHCFNSGFDYKSVVAAIHTQDPAESGRQVIQIKQVIVHPNFDRKTFINDIAVVVLEKPLKFTDYIQPICLPPAGLITSPGTLLTIAGWGFWKSGEKNVAPNLMQVTLPVVDIPTCAASLNPHGFNISAQAMICVGVKEGGRDACQGDSGGPLFAGNGNSNAYTLNGIVSSGYGCARPDMPGVYTKVANYLPWLQTQIGTYGKA